jgi:hypothetical protein
MPGIYFGNSQASHAPQATIHVPQANFIHPQTNFINPQRMHHDIIGNSTPNFHTTTLQQIGQAPQLQITYPQNGQSLPIANASNASEAWVNIPNNQASNYLNGGPQTETEGQKATENVPSNRHMEASAGETGKRVNFNLMNENIRDIE